MIETGSNRFPMVLALLCTALLGGIGYAVWLGYAEQTIPGLAMVVAAIALSAISPAAGLAGVMMALPTMQHINPMPRGEFSLIELAIITSTFGIGLNLLLVSLRSGWRHLGDLFTPAQIVVPAIMLVGATAISLLNLADPSHMTESLREVRLVIIEPLIFFFTARLVLRRDHNRNWVSIVFILTGAAVAVYGVAQIVFDLGGVQAGDITRATALYSHPNNLAIYLERTLLFTLGVCIMRPRWVPMWILASIQAVGLLATFSRGALVGVVVGVGVVLLFIGAWRWIAGLAAAAVVIGLIGLLLFPDRLLDVGGGGTEPTRFAIWRSAIAMVKEHPVFGLGPDQFLYQYIRRFVEPMGWPERYTSHPHNIILDTWLRLGVLGLATLATLIFGVVWLIQRTTAQIRQDAWAIGAVAALFGGFIHSMVDNGFFLADLATISWFLIVIIITVPRAQTASVTAPAKIVDPPTTLSVGETWPTWQGTAAR
ncbi:MAG: O-antigen ligase family protein [Thermomicrobiales bacterium]|nr:O-antigen ligase family protein [Thermomicrobiales bacterium]